MCGGYRVNYEPGRTTVAYDKSLADRAHALLTGVSGLDGKPLFGGYGLFRHRVMFAGVWRSALMVKLYDGTADALLEPHTSGFDPMNTGKPMTGWVVIDPPAIGTDEQLKGWLDRALAAIPAQASRRRQPPGTVKRRKR
jgi:TfoX/Sxy family transcriptional regulator of competence genes